MMFYNFRRAKGYEDVWLNSKYDDDYSEIIYCPRYPGHQRGHRTAWSLHVEFKSNKKADVYKTVYSDWLITEKVAEVFAGAKLTGY